MDKEIRYYLNTAIGFVSFTSLSLYMTYQIQYCRRVFKYRKAQQAETLTPVQLHQVFHQQNQYKDIYAKFKQSKSNPQEYKSLIFLEGIAKNQVKTINYRQNPCCWCSKNIPLLCKVEFSERIHYLTNYQDMDKHSYSFIKFPDTAKFERLPYFRLHDIIKDDAYCTINLNDKCDVKPAIQHISSQAKIRDPGVFETGISVLVLVAKIIIGIFTGSENPILSVFKGVRIGVRQQEVGIKLDSFLTVFGEVIYNIKENTIRIDFPQAMANTKQIYLRKLQLKCMQSKFYKNFFGIVFLGTSAYFARRIFLYYKNGIKKQLKKLFNSYLQNLNDEQIQQKFALINQSIKM